MYINNFIKVGILESTLLIRWWGYHSKWESFIQRWGHDFKERVMNFKRVVNPNVDECNARALYGFYSVLPGSKVTLEGLGGHSTSALQAPSA